MAEARFWPSTSGPTTTDADPDSVVLGLEFYHPSATRWITSIWYWNPGSGTGNTTARVGVVWQVNSASSGTNVSGPHTFTSNTRGQWNEFVLPTPVEMTAGTRYRVAIRHPSGRYGSTNSYWSSGAGGAGLTSAVGVVAPQASAATGSDQCSYLYSGSNNFPTNSFEATNYWCDATITDTEPGGAVDLTVQSATHALASDGPSITQVHELAVDSATMGHAAQNAALTQVHALAVDGAAHGLASDSPALTQAHTLAVDSATHALSSDNVGLGTGLTVDDAGHTVTSDSPALTQTHVLIVDAATHAHTADEVGLSVEGGLAVNHALHALTSSAPTLTQTHQLEVASASHSLSSTDVALTQAHSLTVQGATHAHTAEEPAVNSITTLAVADATHALGSTSPALTQAHVLEVSDAHHAQTAGELALTQLHVLDVDSAAHSLSSDQVALAVTHVLAVADALHALTSSEPGISAGGAAIIYRLTSGGGSASTLSARPVPSLTGRASSSTLAGSPA